MSGQTAGLLWALGASWLCLGGCTPPTADYTDPLVTSGSGPSPYSHLRLAVVRSANTEQTVTQLEQGRQTLRSFGPLTNFQSLADLDPAYALAKTEEILRNRFKEVRNVATASDAGNADVVMVLDLRAVIGQTSGQQTTTEVSGTFLWPGGDKIATVAGRGRDTVPYPATNCRFRSSVNQALAGFARALDGSTELAAVADGSHTPGAVAAGPGRPIPAKPPGGTPLLTGTPPQRWAVCIGISQYQHASRHLRALKYAHTDAERLAAFLKSPAGGGFANDHVLLLTDRKATARAIRTALFGFLKRAVREDLVVIFFSGHGTPDPEKPSNLYLVAYDTDPKQIAGTGIPMWDVETALTRTIAAERVIVLVDACHSAGATEGIKGVRIGDRFNKYFEALAKSRPGRVIFTSSEGYEVSRESKKWGGGHGVFTWAILEALRGKADTDKNKIVTLGEMLDYVDITVRRETANEQHPTHAGVRFDRKLPMGVVK